MVRHAARLPLAEQRVGRQRRQAHPPRHAEVAGEGRRGDGGEGRRVVHAVESERVAGDAGCRLRPAHGGAVATGAGEVPHSVDDQELHRVVRDQVLPQLGLGRQRRGARQFRRLRRRERAVVDPQFVDFAGQPGRAVAADARRCADREGRRELREVERGQRDVRARLAVGVQARDRSLPHRHHVDPLPGDVGPDRRRILPLALQREADDGSLRHVHAGAHVELVADVAGRALADHGLLAHGVETHPVGDAEVAGEGRVRDRGEGHRVVHPIQPQGLTDAPHHVARPAARHPVVVRWRRIRHRALEWPVGNQALVEVLRQCRRNAPRQDETRKRFPHAHVQAPGRRMRHPCSGQHGIACPNGPSLTGAGRPRAPGWSPGSRRRHIVRPWLCGRPVGAPFSVGMDVHPASTHRWRRIPSPRAPH